MSGNAEVKNSSKKWLVLGVVCIILLVALVGSAFQILRLQEKVDELSNVVKQKDSQIQSLQNQIKQKDSQIQSLQNQIKQKDSQIQSLQNQINELNNIVHLQKQETWLNRYTLSQPPGEANYWVFNVQYPGYIEVIVHSSTTSNTYVRVTYNAYGVNFDQKINVGSSGRAVFPVLPGTIRVYVGNSNWFNGATMIISIQYHY